ncbi:MAG: hypothetical protein PF692_01655 [Kiritimatiellae bacterium]|jgi:pyruvate-formate lyase|nr:hypothetical protein [Kiritimatiellia bacterium]
MKKISEQLNPVVAQAVAFTEAYKKNIDQNIAIREVECLKTQYPALMGDIQSGEIFAGGKADDRITFTGTIWWSMLPSFNYYGKQAGYCFDSSAVDRYCKNEEEKTILKELNDFWTNEVTCNKIAENWPDEMTEQNRWDGVVQGNGSGFIITPDYDELIQIGFTGLKQKVLAQKKNPSLDQNFVDAMLGCVEIIENTAIHYIKQAEQKSKDATEDDKKRLIEISATLKEIMNHPPQTLREGIQLLWLYATLLNGKHIEVARMDVALGDLYANDIDEGRLTEEEAIELLEAMWNKYRRHGESAVCRITIGGVGRRNEANADRFCIAAMEACKRHHDVIPQLTLRLYKGQNEALINKAYDVIAEGCVYPMLYNDDIIIPGIVKALNVTEQDAVGYYPLGCGEYMIAACSPSLLTHVINLPRCLDAVLRNGIATNGKKYGIPTGDVEQYKFYDQLYNALLKQFEFTLDISLKSYISSREAHAKYAPMTFASLFAGGCCEKAKSIFDGGVKYYGVCVMGHGFSNLADSLAAIKKMVYENKELTLPQLVELLDSNFESNPSLHKKLLSMPKFGNDDDEVDTILRKLWQDLNSIADTLGKKAGFDFFTVSSVNPGGYYMGKDCGATPEGRKAGMPFAIGNAPTVGMDNQGITAMLNSVSKIDPANGGVATNVKLSPKMLFHERAKTEIIFKAFFANGGNQASITVVNQDDLKDAMIYPEKYPNLLVRVGGWCARFVELERYVQEDIITRTNY